MATIRNTTPYRLTAQAIGRVIEGYEVVEGLTDDEADAVCASGVFERGVLVIPEAPTEAKAPDEAQKDDDQEDEDASPARPVGRRTSRRGAVEAEEAVEDDRETR